MFSTTAMVWANTSLWRWRGSCSRAMFGSSGRNDPARPVSTRNHSPGPGRSATSSLSSSARMRSTDTISSRSCIWRTVATRSSSRVDGGHEPGGPQHAQRIVAEGLLRRAGRPQPAGSQVGGAAEGVDEHRVGQGERHGVDGEVAAREVGLDHIGEVHLGLARLRQVDVGAVGGDLVVTPAVTAADRAEALPLRPDGLGPAPHQLLDPVGRGVRRQVEVDRRRVPATEEVPDGAAHEIDPVTGRREAGRQRGDLVDDGLETFGNHPGDGTEPGRTGS